ncbi:MAG TPA: shikimate dehydrogenase [Bacteroidetes bacterium]|nr:shikimate dehydrogenase [Bacteroidota bacterium]
MKYGLVGKKLDHSFSRTFFTEKFRQEHLKGIYLNFELPEIDNLPALISTHPDLLGFNVTIPYKKDIIAYLDRLSPISRAVGAVNTVKVERDGRTHGYNTDVIGFRDSLNQFYEAAPGGKALILGTGGASLAIDHVLQHYFQFDEIWYASRNPQQENHLAYAQVHETGLYDYRLIVNCTPVGTAPNIGDAPDLPYATLSKENYLFDLIYNPEKSKFLLNGQHQGAHIKNGMDMLVMQAEASWDIWNGNNDI